MMEAEMKMRPDEEEVTEEVEERRKP